MTTTRYYVGIRHNSIARRVFKSEMVPTQSTHGHLFSAVIGPFRTKRGACFCALFGHNNPHIQHVNDAERIAKEVER